MVLHFQKGERLNVLRVEIESMAVDFASHGNEMSIDWPLLCQRKAMSRIESALDVRLQIEMQRCH